MIDRAAEALAIVAEAARLLSAAPDQAVARLTRHAAERLGLACAVERCTAEGEARLCAAGEPGDAAPDLRLALEADGEPLGALAVWTGGRALPADDRVALEAIAGMLVCALEHAALRQQVLDADAARDEALSIASHEFRSPLTALKMVVDTSLRRARTTGDLPQDWVAQKFELAGRQVEHMTRLVHRLLDASRISAGYVDLELEEVDFAAVLREVIERSRKELEWARCAWTLSAPEQVLGLWDRLRLDQIASNLLANAIRFGRGKPIEISLEVDADAARLVVADQGLGIEEAARGRLFRKFERLGRPRGLAGFGLGLWVTRQLVDALGGTITVRDTGGPGATFVVELPRGDSPALPVGEVTSGGR